MKLTMIAAIGKNRELGYKNKLIWHIKEDMEFFKKHTWGKSIIMGMNTFKSLPRLLSNRHHIVITHRELKETDDIRVFHDIDEVLKFLETQDDEIVVIGGASIYRVLLPYADELLITEIDATSEADTFFPEICKDDWNEELLKDFSKEKIPYRHLKYTRKTKA